MSMYFSKLTADYWCPKNKLQEEAKMIAHKADRKLVPETKLDEFIGNLYAAIEKLNQKYHRSVPLQLQRIDSPVPINDTDKFFFIDRVFHIAIYQIKEDK